MRVNLKISPSQVETYLVCARRWAWAHICGIWEPESRGTALGKRVHTIHADYLERGTVPDPGETWVWSQDPKKRAFYPGRIALSMMPRGVYPAPKTGKVEYKINLDVGGVVWVCIIDWHTVVSDNQIIILDHKTSADPVQWGKTVETLPKDPQAVIYARVITEYYKKPNADVIAHWNYGANDASPKKAHVVTAWFKSEELNSDFENRILPIGRELVRLKKARVNPLELPFNADACFLYHKPCKYVENCKLTTQERIGCIVMGNPLVDSLLAEGDDEVEEKTEDTPIPPKAKGDSVNPIETELDENESTVDDKPPLTGANPPTTSRPAVPLDNDEDETPEKPKRTASKSTSKAAPSKSKVVKPDLPAEPPRTAKAVHTSEKQAGDEDLAERLANRIADRIADKIADKLFK